MAADSTTEYEPSYRERTIDQTLDEHDNRISQNEKRWLMTKGALAMLAAVKGIDTAVGHLGSLI
jgi:hypothetical protein